MRKWNKVKLEPLFAAFPADFRLVVADIGSVGGLHHRWKGISDRLVTINFDPLDPRESTESARCYPYLIGDREGQATLHITSRPSMSSTLLPARQFFASFWDKPAHIRVEKTIDAPMTRLDELMAREGLKPDAIKIDVQGGEAGVLAGATETLRSSVLLAEIECSFAARYEGQKTFDQIVARMRELGFALLDVRRLKRYTYENASGVRNPSLGRGMRAGRLGFCDAIFIVEPQQLWTRIEQEGGGSHLGLKAMALSLIYGKADLAAAIFDHASGGMPPGTREACETFLSRFKGDGGWRQRLHHYFDGISRDI